jgi:hypothetical protein
MQLAERSVLNREEEQISIFRAQPYAKVIVIPNATHFIFLSREEGSWLRVEKLNI